MGKKNKKTKGRGAEKAAQKLAKKEQKNEEMEDLEAMIAEFQEMDRKKTTFFEEKSKHPSPRSNLSLTSHPDKDELILFGGEYFNGRKTFMYNDVYVYNIKKNEWTQQWIPNPPPPRCSHQAVAVSKEGGQLWVFGGEFASPTNAQFYHYKDLWVLSLKDHRWEQVKSPGAPSHRSGHRMTAYKKSLFVFGGFQERHKSFIYFNDCYLFDLSEYTWTKLNPTGSGPSPRSACQLAITPSGILVIGGYSKVRVKKEIEKGTSHVDMFLLSNEAETRFKWAQVKDSGQKPWPRSGFALAQMAPNRALIFGGVCDEEEEEDLESVFFNGLNCLDLVSYRWFPMEFRKIKAHTKSRESKGEGEDESCEKPTASKSTMILPCGRMNSLAAIKRNMLYLYGGMFEEDEKQVTLNDLWVIDLKKMDTWQQLVEADDTSADWLENDDNSSDEDDEPTTSTATEKELQRNPAVDEDEDLRTYYRRTCEHWLELASDEASEHERADAIKSRAETLCSNWYEANAQT